MYWSQQRGSENLDLGRCRITLLQNHYTNNRCLHAEKINPCMDYDLLSVVHVIILRCSFFAFLSEQDQQGDVNKLYYVPQYLNIQMTRLLFLCPLSKLWSVHQDQQTLHTLHHGWILRRLQNPCALQVVSSNLIFSQMFMVYVLLLKKI